MILEQEVEKIRAVRHRISEACGHAAVSLTLDSTKPRKSQPQFQKGKMKKMKLALIGLSLLAVFTDRSFCQNTLQFTDVSTTPEKAIHLAWASNTNEVYEIDEADQLALSSWVWHEWFYNF